MCRNTLFSAQVAISVQIKGCIGFAKDVKQSQDQFIASSPQYNRYLSEVIADKVYYESKIKAMNDRVILLEHEVDELKLSIKKNHTKVVPVANPIQSLSANIKEEVFVKCFLVVRSK